MAIGDYDSSRRRLFWVRSQDEDVVSYVVYQQKDYGAWVTKDTLPSADGQWFYEWYSKPLADLAYYAWRIVAFDAAGNEGDPLEIGPVRVVRVPDGPKLTASFSEVTTKITVDEA